MILAHGLGEKVVLVGEILCYSGENKQKGSYDERFAASSRYLFPDSKL